MSSASHSRADLAAGLLSREQAEAIVVHGDRDASVLIATYERDGALHVVLTRRRADLRLHPGQISFPGGSPDPGEDLQDAALREAHEEIGLQPSAVDLIGSLPPTPTFVSGFRVHSFVGLITPPDTWTISESEVAAVLEPSVQQLREGFARRTVPTPRGDFTHGTYLLGDDSLIWGATARIVGNLLAALP